VVTLEQAPGRPSAVPYALVATTGRSALQLAGAGSLRALGGSGASILAQGVVDMMAWSSLKTSAALTAAVVTPSSFAAAVKLR
jgi:hypothetical protein